jgi:hypothetical protein
MGISFDEGVPALQVQCEIETGGLSGYREGGSRKLGSTEPEAVSRKPEAGSRKPEAGSWKLEAESWKLKAGS